MDENKLSPPEYKFYQKGLAALKKKNYDYAIELFQEVLKTQQDFAPGQHNLWSAVREKNRTHPPSTLEVVIKKIKTIILNLNFFVLAALNKTEPAVAVLKKIILLNPDNIPSLNKLAIIFMRQSKNKNALFIWEEILLINKKNINALRHLSRLHFKNKDYQKAKATAKILSEAHPHDLEAENILKDIAALGAIEEGFDNIRPAT